MGRLTGPMATSRPGLLRAVVHHHDLVGFHSTPQQRGNSKAATLKKQTVARESCEKNPWTFTPGSSRPKRESHYPSSNLNDRTHPKEPTTRRQESGSVEDRPSSFYLYTEGSHSQLFFIPPRGFATASDDKKGRKSRPQPTHLHPGALAQLSWTISTLPTLIHRAAIVHSARVETSFLNQTLK